MAETFTTELVPSNEDCNTQGTVETLEPTTNTSANPTTTVTKAFMSNESFGEKNGNNSYFHPIHKFSNRTHHLPNTRESYISLEDCYAKIVLAIIFIAIIYVAIFVVAIGCYLCRKKSRRNTMLKSATVTGTETVPDGVKTIGTQSSSVGG